MAEVPSERLTSSWCVVDRDGKSIDQVEENTTEEAANSAPSIREASDEHPNTLSLAPPTDLSDRLSAVATPDISIESEDGSSDHSDFEVFEKDCGGEVEESKDEKEKQAVNEEVKEEKKPTVSSNVSHEQRIRLALNNLRGGNGQPQAPTPLDSPHVEDVSMNENNQQAAEPPRVQIIRLNADEESLPESDIQLEEAQGSARGLFVQEQYDVLMDGGRVRRYQHLPNPNLNARLNSLVLGALLFVIGLAVGHFIGSTHERFSQHYQRVDCLDRVKNIQNELLRCARKYDEMELQLNEVKATLVQKEYVDKWESLYQEGEEEKATLTASMNLYKSRYMKQQQLLDERLDRIKSLQNDLLRCTHKYEQLELKQNEQKANLVQKEYVDKWESLYQEGEEEKAALTATMNLYKSRYNKQKQLLTQCEVHYQDLQEQFSKLKQGRTNMYGQTQSGPYLPHMDFEKCESRSEALTLRINDLEKQLANCTEEQVTSNITNQLFLLLKPILDLNGGFDFHLNSTFFKSAPGHLRNNTKIVLEKLQERYNFTANVTQLIGNWLNATFLSGNNSEKFSTWVNDVRQRINATDVYGTLSQATVAISDNMKQLFDILSAAMKNITERGDDQNTGKEPFYKRMKTKLMDFGKFSSLSLDGEKVNHGTLSAAWQKTLKSTRDVWEAGVRKASDVLKGWKPQLKEKADSKVTESFVKRKLTSVPQTDEEAKMVTPSRDTELKQETEKVVLPQATATTRNVSEAAGLGVQAEHVQKSQAKSDSSSWFDKRAESRRSFHDVGANADWFWRSRDSHHATKADEDERTREEDFIHWPDSVWYTRRRMGRAEARVRKILNYLSDKMALHKWLERRKKLRDISRRMERKRSKVQGKRRKKPHRVPSQSLRPDMDGDDDDVGDQFSD